MAKTGAVMEKINNCLLNKVQRGNKYHHGNLRQTLIDIACKHIREKGVDGLSLRAIAKEAGVSANAPYRHFSDKRALLIAIAIAGFEDLTARMRAVEENAPDILDEFLVKGQAYVSFAGEFPEKYKLMFGPAITDRMDDEGLITAAGDCYERLLDSVQRGIDAGLFKNVPVEELADPVWAMTHGVSSLLIDGFFEEDAQKFRQQRLSCPTMKENCLEELLKNNLQLMLHGMLA